MLSTWTGHHYLQEWRSCYPPLIYKKRTGNILRKRVSTGAYIAATSFHLHVWILPAVTSAGKAVYQSIDLLPYCPFWGAGDRACFQRCIDISCARPSVIYDRQTQ